MSDRTVLSQGDKVRVLAATYSAVKVGTVAKIERVRVDMSAKRQNLYELAGWPEYLFWRHELAAVSETVDASA